jgi:hypothetical protein
MECPVCEASLVDWKCPKCGADIIKELHRKWPLRYKRIAAWLLTCAVLSAVVLWIMGFFYYSGTKESPVVFKSMVYNNPTYLFLGFGFIGLMIGFYTGFSDKPDWTASMTKTIELIMGLVIVTGATSLVLFEATPHQLRIIGGCLAMLAAFAIIGAGFGFVLRTQWPVSPEEELLLNAKYENEVKLQHLQRDFFILQEKLEGNPENEKLQKTVDRIASYLEKFGLIGAKKAEEEVEGEEKPKEPKPAEELIPEAIVGAALVPEEAAAAPALKPKEKKKKSALKAAAVPKEPIVPTAVRRATKANIPLGNIVSAQEAKLAAAQIETIDELLKQAKGFKDTQ